MAVLWEAVAEGGTLDAAVATSVFDATGSANYPNSLMYYKNDTPVPSTGATKYFRITTVNNQSEAGNLHDIAQINLTPGTRYLLGAFLRFDRIGAVDIWHDSGATPDSYDKCVEFNGTIRGIIATGNPDWVTTGVEDKFTFGIYFGEPHCTACNYEQVEPNVSPYTRNAPYLADYEKWYALVLGVTPSTGGSNANGRLELWVNGTKTHDYQNVKTQDSATPYVNLFYYSPTIAQPTYDGPAHYRKSDQFTFANDIQDMIDLGLMGDPEVAAGPSGQPTSRRFWGVPGHAGYSIRG